MPKELNRQVRQAKNMVAAVKKAGFPVQLDRASVADLQAALIRAVEDAFAGMLERFDETTGKMTELQAEQTIMIQPESMTQLAEGLKTAVGEIKVPELPAPPAPVSYRVDNIVTDRSGNIVSVDIHPMK